MDTTAPSFHQKRNRTVDNQSSDYRATVNTNSSDLRQTVKDWFRTDATSCLQYCGDFAYCEIHNAVVTSVNFPAKADTLSPECNLCSTDNVLNNIMNANISPRDAEERWLSLKLEQTDMEERLLDAQDEQKGASVIQREMNHWAPKWEVQELKAWLAYTIEAWKASVIRRAEPTSMINPYLKRYAARIHQRGQSSTTRGKVYCFEHHQVGDFVMHRAQSAYMECGICLLSKTDKAESTRRSTYALSAPINITPRAPKFIQRESSSSSSSSSNNMPLESQESTFSSTKRSTNDAYERKTETKWPTPQNEVPWTQSSYDADEDALFADTNRTQKY